jgi:hypothetical protein
MSHLKKPATRKPPQSAETAAVASTPTPTSGPIPGVAYTEREAAVFLRLRNARTLSVWRCTGRAPGLRWRRVGSKVVYLGEHILEYLSTEPTRAKRPVYIPEHPRKASPAKAASTRKLVRGA